MLPNVQFSLNQQFQQGCNLAQQGVLAEQAGNPMFAAQSYDQAIGMIGNAVGAALQYGIPVLHNVYFALAFCHFNSARIKAATGWVQYVPAHLNFALQAINQAINMNPGFAMYHSAAGLILLGQSNLPEAARAFQRAVQLNPADSWSQWMLSSLYTAQGNLPMANQFYTAAASAQPNLPPPQTFVPPQFQTAGASAGPAPSGAEKKRDWFELINNALTFGNGLMKAFDSGSSSAGQAPAWPGAGGGWNMNGF
jgi:tetratricopeptide (TPR) repeat protein